MQILLFVLGFLLFIGLIVIHEWGHYKAAKRNGVKVEEFGIGLPPMAWSKKLKNGMIFSLNWLPLGGFVRMKGENDSDTRPGSYGAAGLWAKTKILLAGVAMNFVTGVVLLTLLALVGMPKILNEQVVGQDQFTVASDSRVVNQEVRVRFVLDDTPASKAGLASLDIIKSVSSGTDSRTIKTVEDLQLATDHFAGRPVNIEYQRSGKNLEVKTTLLTDRQVEQSQNTENPKAHLGVVPVQMEVDRYTWSSPVVALGFTWQLIELTFKGLGHALAGLGSIIAGLATGNDVARQAGQAQAGSQVGGPIAIVAVLWSSGTFGINFLLMIIAILSLTLAIMNILPIPALDGGRLAMTLVSRVILKRPLSKATEEKIIGGSMLVILALIVLISIVDVNRFL